MLAVVMLATLYIDYSFEFSVTHVYKLITMKRSSWPWVMCVWHGPNSSCRQAGWLNGISLSLHHSCDIPHNYVIYYNFM